ncbi:MAG: hypothetical protein JWO48_3103 [Bryobacterales bacterium]|nr:hypothetical protein [Bryobacterales bacterium]
MPDPVKVTIDLLEATFALFVGMALVGLYAALAPYLEHRKRPSDDRTNRK